MVLPTTAGEQLKLGLSWDREWRTAGVFAMVAGPLTRLAVLQRMREVPMWVRCCCRFLTLACG